MLNLVLLFVFAVLSLPADGHRQTRRTTTTTSTEFIDESLYTKYPQSYRDFVYKHLSESGKEIFYAVNKHPSCVEKKGQCIPRHQCIEKKFLYISRVCYRRDLVCCYDDSIRIPIVGTDSYTSTTTLPPSTKAP